MNTNDILLILTAGLSVLYVLFSWKLGKERLYSAIIVFLILIAAVGGKIVEFFGHETNTGNIFYASIFLATYFLIERHGKRAGLRSIVIGIFGVVFFVVLARLTSELIGSPSTQELSEAAAIALNPVPRVAFASLVAYAISQTLNVYFYLYLKEVWNTYSVWFRANCANALAQVVDSTLFFSIAFWSLVPPSNIVDLIFTGLAIKIVFMMVTAPLLTFNRVEEEEGDGSASIAVR